jgi:hypothetical protein
LTEDPVELVESPPVPVPSMFRLVMVTASDPWEFVFIVPVMTALVEKTRPSPAVLVILTVSTFVPLRVLPVASAVPVGNVSVVAAADPVSARSAKTTNITKFTKSFFDICIFLSFQPLARSKSFPRPLSLESALLA